MLHLLSMAMAGAGGAAREAEPGTFGAAGPQQHLPEAKNYAGDAKVEAWVLTELVPLMAQTRMDRAAMHDEWASIREMNQMQHGSGRRYFGRSDSYLPLYRKTRSTIIRNLSRGLFPSDEYFDVVDRGSGDPERAKPTKVYLKWELEKVARLRAYMKPLLGQLADYGTSPMKYWYKRELGSVGAPRDMDPLLRAVLGRTFEFKKLPVYEGLAVSPRSVFYWYMYPVTAESLDDASLVFEDIDLPLAYFEAMKRQGRWRIPDDFDAESVPEHDTEQTKLLDARGSHPQQGRADTGKLGRVLQATEAWTFAVLPSSAYLEHEDPREPLPVRVVTAGGKVLEVTRNPFFHQRPPYLCARMDWEPGFFYGNAAGRTIKPLQLLANDFANQTNDNGIFALNPMAILNPSAMLGVPRPMVPGGVWFSNDPANAVRFERPPMEQVGLGMQMVREFIGMGNDFGGAPPILQGTSAKGGGRTATGAQILQRNATSELQDVVEDIELDVMVPLLQGAWRNAQQFRSEDVMVAVAGESIRVTPEQLGIDAEFSWLASSQATNAQMRAQQGLSLIQAVAPIVPLIMQQGYVVDFVGLIRRVYTDGLGFRGFSEFIRPAQAVPGAQMGMPIAPGQMPGVQQEQGDRLRSALEQLTGAAGADTAAPGEGEAFNEVRSQADDMAALMGGGGMM